MGSLGGKLSFRACGLRMQGFLLGDSGLRGLEGFSLGVWGFGFRGLGDGGLGLGGFRGLGFRAPESVREYLPPRTLKFTSELSSDPRLQPLPGP